MEVSRYLHLNCVRVRSLASSSYQGQWDYVLSYGWSSLPGYIRAANKVKYVSYDLILSLAGGYKGYQEFVWDGLRRGIENPFTKVQSRLILGNKDYLARVKRSNRDHLRRRLQERMAKDPVVQKQWVEIEKEICDKCRM